MQIDRSTLQKLLTLSDRQLEMVVRKLAAEWGLDLSQFEVTPGNMESLRQALGSATDEDIARLSAQLSGGKGNK